MYLVCGILELFDDDLDDDDEEVVPITGRSALVNLFAGIQWLGFMFANTVVIPLSIGAAFHQSPGDIAGAMARSFLITGLACLIQVFAGHRMPLMEGQSGLWWGVILGLAQMGVATGLPLAAVGGSISLGIVLGGIAILLCGAAGVHRFLNRLFTPVVMAVLLFLLAAQLIDIFFQGMLGIPTHGQVDLPIAGLSLLVALFVSILTIAGRGLVSNFSILIGLSVGWIAHVALFGPERPVVQPSLRELAHWFPWGTPHIHAGILITCVITALLNTTNTIATLRAAEPVFGRQVTEGQYKRSLVLSGVYTAVSGPLGLVPYAPYTSSIGFLRTTRLYDRAPFAIGAALFTAFGLIPPLSGFFATMPVSIGNAVLFVAYLQLFGAALANLEGMSLDFRNIFRIAAPTLVGLAILSTPPQMFAALPAYVQSLCSNGMLVGILLAILLELLPWHKIARQ
jgi:xanthine/uracil permease